MTRRKPYDDEAIVFEVLSGGAFADEGDHVEFACFARVYRCVSDPDSGPVVGMSDGPSASGYIGVLAVDLRCFSADVSILRPLTPAAREVLALVSR